MFLVILRLLIPHYVDADDDVDTWRNNVSDTVYNAPAADPVVAPAAAPTADPAAAPRLILWLLLLLRLVVIRGCSCG
jgi:hypothetical protein